MWKHIQSAFCVLEVDRGNPNLSVCFGLEEKKQEAEATVISIDRGQKQSHVSSLLLCASVNTPEMKLNKGHVGPVMY